MNTITNNVNAFAAQIQRERVQKADWERARLPEFRAMARTIGKSAAYKALRRYAARMFPELGDM